MNVYKILEQALNLMGIYSISQEVKKSGLLIINTVCEDLKLPLISSLEENVDYKSQKELIVLTYGVAMRIALSMSDDYLKETFEGLYSKKLKELKNTVSSVKDQIFKGEI